MKWIITIIATLFLFFIIEQILRYFEKKRDNKGSINNESNDNESSNLVKKAYECGVQAESFRKWNTDLGFLNACLQDEEGIKYLEEAIKISSSLNKEKNIKILIRVCIGLANDYLQYDDITNANKISRKICKYGSYLNDAIFYKPTQLGFRIEENLSKLMSGLTYHYGKKLHIINNEGDMNETNTIINELYSIMRKWNN